MQQMHPWLLSSLPYYIINRIAYDDIANHIGILTQLFLHTENKIAKYTIMLPGPTYGAKKYVDNAAMARLSYLHAKNNRTTPIGNP